MDGAEGGVRGSRNELAAVRAGPTVDAVSGRSPAPPATLDSSATLSTRDFARDRAARVIALRTELEGLVAARPRAGVDGWTLELGTGHGHFLTAYAARHPEAECLGFDFCRDRIRRAERKLQRARLPNLCFLHAEATEFLDAVPPDMRFQRVFVLFPDPWPKRRHRKHRLVSPLFLDRMAGLTLAGAQFFFRSDALDYVEEVRTLIEAHGRWSLVPGGNLPFETETVFQAKAPGFGSLAAVRVS